MTMSNETHVHVFDPERCECSANEWLRTVESFARDRNFGEDQMYAFARGKLSGSAKVWLGRSKVASWNEFRPALQEAFPESVTHPGTIRKHRDSIDRRKKLSNETVDQYMDEMVRLGQQVDAPEELIVRHIVTGLSDPVLTKAIPSGARLRELRRAIAWQKELETLTNRYTAAEVTVDDFQRLADRMEDIVLGGENFLAMLQGDRRTLTGIGTELSSLLRQHRAALSCNLSNLGTSRTHRIVVSLRKNANLSERCTTKPPGDKGRTLQTSLISHLTWDVIQKSPVMQCEHRTVAYVQERSELLLDLTQLNAGCHREPANLLRAQPLLTALAGFRYFTTLDFNAGHLQIPIEPASRHYFAFMTPYGPYEFQRAPKHFANTTIIFNKILIELARKLPAGTVVVLNDVLVLPSRDTGEGLQNLSCVLTALRAFGLTADLRRSRFFETQIKLFNWIVQEGEVISTGLPFEFQDSAGHRLTLLIRRVEGTTFESLLHWQPKAEGDRRLTVGSFRGKAHETDVETEDGTVRLVKHLIDSIEHFEQFLLFVPFGVLLSEDVQMEDKTSRMLLKVQQFDFKLIIEDSKGN